jgi:hypothetical protein
MMPTKNKLTISPEMLKYLTETTNKSLEKYKKTKLPTIPFKKRYNQNIFTFYTIKDLYETNHLV